MDLSHPKGTSVNDGVEPDMCSLPYASVDDASAMIVRLDQGVKLAKLDIVSAYRIVLIHPEDRPLLRMMGRGSVYVDTALPFGLRSAPKVFTALADALELIFWRNEGCGSIHYLGDFFLWGQQGPELVA